MNEETKDFSSLRNIVMTDVHAVADGLLKEGLRIDAHGIVGVLANTAKYVPGGIAAVRQILIDLALSAPEQDDPRRLLLAVAAGFDGLALLCEEKGEGQELIPLLRRDAQRARLRAELTDIDLLLHEQKPEEAIRQASSIIARASELEDFELASALSDLSERVASAKKKTLSARNRVFILAIALAFFCGVLAVLSPSLRHTAELDIALQPPAGSGPVFGSGARWCVQEEYILRSAASAINRLPNAPPPAVVQAYENSVRAWLASCGAGYLGSSRAEAETWLLSQESNLVGQVVHRLRLWGVQVTSDPEHNK